MTAWDAYLDRMEKLFPKVSREEVTRWWNDMTIDERNGWAARAHAMNMRKGEA